MRVNKAIGTFLAVVLSLGNLVCACDAMAEAGGSSGPANHHSTHSDNHGQATEIAPSDCLHANCQGDCPEATWSSDASAQKAGAWVASSWPDDFDEPDRAAFKGIDPPPATSLYAATAPPVSAPPLAADTPVRRFDRLLD